jgi:hypothetical protein
MKHFKKPVLALVFAMSGCGLADYEAKMAEEQARVRHIEDENKNLENPLEIPPPKTDKEKEANLPDFFFRPPKGIAKTANKDLYGGLLWVYPRTGASDGVQDVYIGFSKGKKDYVKDVLKKLPSSTTPKNSTTEVTPWGREPVHFDTVTVDDPNSSLVLHILQTTDQQILIGFRLDRKTDSSQLSQRLAMSLESIGVGVDAGKLRKEFRLRNSAGKTSSGSK